MKVNRRNSLVDPVPSLNADGIVLAPYGSLSPRALATYERILEAYKLEFPGSPVRLAFTSQFMIKRLLEKEGIVILSPLDALAGLYDQGCRRAVVQSLQIVPGEEFHKLASLVHNQGSQVTDSCVVRLEIGLPLLSSLEDCQRVSRVLPRLWSGPDDRGKGPLEGQPQSLQSLPDRDPETEVVLLAGHGTGHPADALYSLMARVLEKNHCNVFLGTLEGFPGLCELINELKCFNVRKVRLLPFLLVAGGHAENDIAGEGPQSWKSALEKEGFEVDVHLCGLGEEEGILSVFLEHTRTALKR